MRKIINKLGLIGTAVVIAVLAGCLVSGTFIIVEDITFTASSGFYFYQIDFTDEDDWEDHKDKIDFIDAVGVVLYFTSTEASDVTFNVYIDDLSSGTTPTSVPGTATKIIDDLIVAPGQTTLTYAQSLSIITGLPRLKALAKTGQFDFYATSSSNTGGTFVVDSGKIVVTVSAGN
ncbi:MAG: hypothetical protein KAR42_05725 [candidate division Zixibacteria bacterium]|nr:hypothetical protein [candidate division Zixibacteria bacterium]